MPTGRPRPALLSGTFPAAAVLELVSKGIWLKTESKANALPFRTGPPLPPALPPCPVGPNPAQAWPPGVARWPRAGRKVFLLLAR